MKPLVLAAILRLSPANPEADAIAAAIAARAEVERVPPALLVSLAWHESRFSSGARHPRTGCSGMFQVAAFWWRRLRAAICPTAPAVARDAFAGARVLRYYADKCRAGWVVAVSAYNSNVCRASAFGRMVVATARSVTP